MDNSVIIKYFFKKIICAQISPNTLGGQESWGKDSGARDLSPADLQPHPLMPINNDEMVSNKVCI